jgi:hypothetical protein
MVGGGAGAGAPASNQDGFGGSSYSGDGPVGIFGDGHASRIAEKRSESAKGFLTRSFYY